MVNIEIEMFFITLLPLLIIHPFHSIWMWVIVSVWGSVIAVRLWRRSVCKFIQQQLYPLYPNYDNNNNINSNNNNNQRTTNNIAQKLLEKMGENVLQVKTTTLSNKLNEVKVNRITNNNNNKIEETLMFSTRTHIPIHVNTTTASSHRVRRQPSPPGSIFSMDHIFSIYAYLNGLMCYFACVYLHLHVKTCVCVCLCVYN